MSLEARLATLATKHSELEHNIDIENHRPHPDSLKLMTLKRQKLKLKEQLAHSAGH